jgi:hypothetical protein
VILFYVFPPLLIHLPDALSQGSLYDLDMGNLKAANSTAIGWNLVQKAPYPDNYTPVMALAQNHIHFLDVGDDGPGNARIFVIHCTFPFQSESSNSHMQLDSYFQPEIQNYPGDKTFPAIHGQATSFFMDTGVQQEFAYIPDDFSATYVINVENNSTRTLPPPTSKDTGSSYVAGITSLVQLDSTGAVSFVPYVPGDVNANANASWSNVKSLAGLVSSYNLQSNSSANNRANNTTTPGNTGTTTPSDADGASSNFPVAPGLVGLAVLFAILGFF